MKSEKDLAILVMRANVPAGVLTVEGEPIAYHTDGAAVVAYKFTSRGGLRCATAPVTPVDAHRVAFRAWDKEWVVPTPGVSPRVSVPLTGVVIPDEARRQSRNARAARYADTRVRDYVTAHVPEGYFLHPAVPHVALRRNAATLEVWRVSTGKALGHAYYKDRDGTRVTRHPIINGTAIVDGIELTVEGSVVTHAVVASAARTRAIPNAVLAHDEYADLRFNDLTPPIGYARVPGLRVWYKPLWRAVNGATEVGLELRWGESPAASVEVYGVERDGTVLLSDRRYTLTRDFKMISYPVL